MNCKIKLNKLLLIATAISSISTGNASAETNNNYLKLSEKLVALRGEVSDLSNELQKLRDQHKLEMRGLITQKNSTSANIKQEKMALDQLQESLIKNKKRIKEIGSDKDSIKYALLAESEKLKRYIKTGLPFKVEARLKSLEDFEKRLQADVLSSHKAANTLWSMIEDELKLARDNGVYRQSVVINQKEYLAHVAKIGMVMMYMRFGDEEYGQFRKTGNTWRAEKNTDTSEIEKIKTLFTALEKQIHIGYFELPNTL